MDKSYEELVDDGRSGKARILVVAPPLLGFGPAELRRIAESLEPAQLATLETIVILDDFRRPQPLELPVLDAAFFEQLMAPHKPSLEDQLAEEAKKRRSQWWKQPGARKWRRIR